MYMKFFLSDLNPDRYTPHSISTYTYGATIILRVCDGINKRNLRMCGGINKRNSKDTIMLW